MKKTILAVICVLGTLASCYQEDEDFMTPEYSSQVVEKKSTSVKDSINIPPIGDYEVYGDPPPKDVGGNGARPGGGSTK